MNYGIMTALWLSSYRIDFFTNIIRNVTTVAKQVSTFSNISLSLSLFLLMGYVISDSFNV